MMYKAGVGSRGTGFSIHSHNHRLFKPLVSMMIPQSRCYLPRSWWWIHHPGWQSTDTVKLLGTAQMRTPTTPPTQFKVPRAGPRPGRMVITRSTQGACSSNAA
jgi:hypothetical protein